MLPYDVLKSVCVDVIIERRSEYSPSSDELKDVIRDYLQKTYAVHEMHHAVYSSIFNSVEKDLIDAALAGVAAEGRCDDLEARYGLSIRRHV